MTNGNSEAGKKPIMVESILDLNANNVWDLSDYQIGELWERDRKEEDFSTSEDKLLNIIRLAFEVVHYNVDDPRDVKKYESGGWVKICHCNPARGVVAIRRKSITRISDLSYENIRHISAAKLMEVIERNFGGGWDSLSQSIQDIILTGFDISTTTLPQDRLHKPGGLYEKKVNDGFEVLEIAKGTWVEAIFAKEKPETEKPRMKFGQDDLDDKDYDDDEDLPENDYEDEEEDDDDDSFDDDKLTEESYRTTFETNPDDLNLEAEDVADDDY